MTLLSIGAFCEKSLFCFFLFCFAEQIISSNIGLHLGFDVDIALYVQILEPFKYYHGFFDKLRSRLIREFDFS